MHATTGSSFQAPFFWHEVEEEFRTRNIDWCFKGNESENLEEALNAINDLRKGELYEHEQANCSTLCKEKGEFFLVYYSVRQALCSLSRSFARYFSLVFLLTTTWNRLIIQVT